jgi:UDP-N-acetylglucosamine transferase subunit ALG13
MIFITVGTQLAFDRMIQPLDQYCQQHPELEVFAQIGASDYSPMHMQFEKFITPAEAEDKMKHASLIIAHAGMGSILTALDFQTPIIVMPRKASLGEHRNEHQLATCDWVKDLNGVTVAQDEGELITLLEDFNRRDDLISIEPYAEQSLLDFLAHEISGS